MQGESLGPERRGWRRAAPVQRRKRFGGILLLYCLHFFECGFRFSGVPVGVVRARHTAGWNLSIANTNDCDNPDHV